jgi:hypothetical protein
LRDARFEQRAGRRDRELRGYFAGRQAPEPVRQRQDDGVGRDVEAVLVVLALAPDVGGTADFVRVGGKHTRAGLAAGVGHVAMLAARPGPGERTGQSSASKPGCVMMPGRAVHCGGAIGTE